MVSDISIKGFWYSRWVNNTPMAERKQMYEELSQMCKTGELLAPKHELIPMEDHKRAIEGTLKGFKKGGKFIIDMRSLE